MSEGTNDENIFSFFSSFCESIRINANIFQMNFSKKFKRGADDDDDDDDVVIIESPPNDVCQEIDETCREFASVVCLHCQLRLCYVHLESHRLRLLNERDALIDEFNQHLQQLHHWQKTPDDLLNLLTENYERKFQRRFAFPQRSALVKLLDLDQLFNALNDALQLNGKILNEQKGVSVVQLDKLQQSFAQYEERKRVKRTFLFVSVSSC